MLETGISSTLRIATFWGLVDAAHRQDDTADTRTEDYIHTGEILMPGALTDDSEAENEADRSNRRRHAIANAQPAGIQKIIEDALRAAGLMK